MKILMICMGNICRSPLAEGILKRLVKQEELDWEVDSAGTGNWHVGEHPDYRARRVARDHDIDISNQTCRQFIIEDFDKFDLIFAMDKYNLANIWSQARHKDDRRKVKLLLGDKEVPDPYYSNMFDYAYELIEEGCKNIITTYNQSLQSI